MDTRVLNKIFFIGEGNLLKKLLRIIVSENPNITNLLPIPKDLPKEKENTLSEKLKFFKSYKVSNYSEWITTYWGNEAFGDITLINEEDNKISFNFYSELSDAKIILINIQKKYPKLKVNAEFQFGREYLNERFETKMINGEVYYRINDDKYHKYSNHIQLRIDEILNNKSSSDLKMVA
jgi:hypothetical protein